MKATILGNLRNFCNEFLPEREGKVLEILHLLKMQMYIIKRSKAAEPELSQEKVMFKIRLGTVQWMYLSELHLLEVSSGEVS